MPVAQSSDGVDVTWYDLGGSGPELILAHATGFCAGVWKPIARRLTDRFHVFAFDERGHGASGGAPDGNYQWDGFALDAEAVIEHAGLDRPFAAGHSCGGALLFLAEQAHPGTLRAIWAFEPIMFPKTAPPGLDNPLAAGARRRRATFGSYLEARDHYAAKPPFDVLDPEALDAYVIEGMVDVPDGVRLACEPETEARIYEMGGRHGAFAGLDSVACPATLLCGEHTDAITPALLALQAERLRDATTEVWAGHGHFGPLVDPERAAASMAVAFAPLVD